MKLHSVTFPYAQVVFGKAFNYNMEAIFQQNSDIGGNNWVLKSCTGTCQQTNVVLDFSDLIKLDEGLEKHVLNCIQESWTSDDIISDELMPRRLKRLEETKHNNRPKPPTRT